MFRSADPVSVHYPHDIDIKAVSRIEMPVFFIVLVKVDDSHHSDMVQLELRMHIHMSSNKGEKCSLGNITHFIKLLPIYMNQIIFHRKGMTT